MIVWTNEQIERAFPRNEVENRNGRFEPTPTGQTIDMGDGTQLTGWKGSTKLETGFFYCPYIPLTKPAVIDGDFTPKKPFKTKYSTYQDPQINRYFKNVKLNDWKLELTHDSPALHDQEAEDELGNVSLGK